MGAAHQDSRPSPHARRPWPSDRTAAQRQSGQSGGRVRRAVWAYFSSSVCLTAVRGKYTSMAWMPTPCKPPSPQSQPGGTSLMQVPSCTPCGLLRLRPQAWPKDGASARREKQRRAKGYAGPRTLDDSLVSNTIGSVRSTILVHASVQAWCASPELTPRRETAQSSFVLLESCRKMNGAFDVWATVMQKASARPAGT